MPAFLQDAALPLTEGFLLRAGPTYLEVGQDLLIAFNAQLTAQKVIQEGPRLLAISGLKNFHFSIQAVCDFMDLSMNRFRNVALALFRRDMIVPIGTSIISAISK